MILSSKDFGRRWLFVVAAVGCFASGCSDDAGTTSQDTTGSDTVADASATDTIADASATDTGTDASATDAGTDASATDTGAATDTSTDTGAATDTGTATDTGGGDVVSSGTIAFTLRFTDFVSSSPLEGLTVSVLDETATTDADGEVTLSVPPNADLKITMTGPGVRDYFIYHHTGASDVTLNYAVATDTTVAALEAVLQMSVDDSKGLLSVAPRERGTFGAIPGMTITADAASDLALVFDASSGTGLSPGNTTLDGSSSTAIFVNIAAGDVTPSFDSAWGWTCDGPSPIDVPAGAYVIAEYLCSYTPVEIGLELTDFLTAAPIAGATVAILGQTLTTNDQGMVAFDAPPNEDIKVAVTASGVRDYYLYRRTPDHDVVLSYALATDATIAALESALGQTVDDSKGLISISPREEGTLAMMDGMTVTLDVASDLALVFDSGATTGLSAGNTTLAGSSSTVVFINAAPGQVTPTFSDSNGDICDVGPLPVDVPAGSYVVANYQCHAP